VFEQLNERGNLELVKSVLDPVWVHKVDISIYPRHILPVGGEAGHGGVYEVFLHPHDRVSREPKVKRVGRVRYLERTITLDTLDHNVIHSIVFHTGHKLLEKLGTLLITLRVGHHRYNIEVLTIHL
jgi:hypothetical protein